MAMQPTQPAYNTCDRRDGHEIDSHEIERPNGDGTVNRVRVYVLRVKDARQCELNLEP